MDDAHIHAPDLCKDPPAPETSNLSQPPRPKQPPSGKRKRPPFAQGRKGKPTSLQQSKAMLKNSALLTIPLRTIFPIFISIRNLSHLVDVYYSTSIVYDRHILQVPKILIHYITALCSLKKLFQSDFLFGHYDADFYQLDNLLSNVQLPTILADFVDSIGKVTIGNGLVVSPSLNVPRNDYVAERMLDMAMFFGDNNLLLDLEQYQPRGRWFISAFAVQQYLLLLPRLAAKTQVRSCAAGVDGQLNLIVSIEDHGAEITPYAPVALQVESARLGALFGWNENIPEQWPNTNKILHPWTKGVTYYRHTELAQLATTCLKSKRRDDTTPHA